MQNNKGLKVFVIIISIIFVLSVLSAIAGAALFYTNRQSFANNFNAYGEVLENWFADIFQVGPDGGHDTDDSIITPDEGAPNVGQDGDIIRHGTPDYDSDRQTLSVRDIAARGKKSVVGIVVTAYNGSGGGSGIVLTEDGYIVTNAHVVEGAQTIKVVLDDAAKTEYTATVIGQDAQTDIAVIKAEGASDLTPGEFGDSDKLAEGDIAVAVGNPRGLELQGTVTVGYISAINRNLDVDGQILTLIQTDAAINPGNSGGALLNEFGQVIGINSRKFSTELYEGLAFAIPSNIAVPIINELKSNGRIEGRPMFGITGATIDAQTAFENNLPRGVYIETVEADSDMAAKGVKSEDIIVAVNGIRINSLEELNAQKSKYKAGDTVKITVVRQREQLEFEIVLGTAK